MVVNTVYSCELVENVYLIVRVHICIRFIQVRVVKKFYTIKILFILFSFQTLLYYTHAGLTTLNINRKFSKTGFLLFDFNCSLPLPPSENEHSRGRKLKKGSLCQCGFRRISKSRCNECYADTMRHTMRERLHSNPVCLLVERRMISVQVQSISYLNFLLTRSLYVYVHTTCSEEKVKYRTVRFFKSKT